MRTLIIKTKIDCFNFSLHDQSYVSVRMFVSDEKSCKRILPVTSFLKEEEMVEPFIGEGDHYLRVVTDDPLLRGSVLSTFFQSINEKCSGINFFPYDESGSEIWMEKAFSESIKARKYGSMLLTDSVVIHIDTSKLLSITLDGESLI